MAGITLLYIASDRIVQYISQNPIDWDDRDKAKRGGVGDRAGITPTPAVEEFLRLYIERRELFTQKEYMVHCWEQWRDWIIDKPLEQKLGIKAKLYGNFYPSMIDSLHVWAMLSESRMFSSCVLNSTEDAIGKTDMIVTCGVREIRLALIGPKEAASNDRAYKLKYRSPESSDIDCVEVVLPREYPKTPGNKRWFRSQDLMESILGATSKQRAIKEQSAIYQVVGA